MAQSADHRPPAQPAPPLSRRARRRITLLFWGGGLLCLGLLAAAFLLTRSVPNGRVGTGPYALDVENGLSEAVCALHIGEAEPGAALSRNKLGSGVLLAGERFRLFGLEAQPYALRAWTCDGRPTRVVDVTPGEGPTVWRIVAEILD